MRHTLGTLHPWLKGVAAVLFLTLVGAGLLLAMLLHGASPALAASLQHAMGTTCAQAPSAQHCDTQDPELQGCAADATTLAQQDLVENGTVIGRVERRFSLACSSWWGRVFDQRSGPARGNQYIEVAGSTTSALPTFEGPAYSILYSPMVFDASPNQTVPEITGSLTIDAITPNISATLPAIVLQGQ